ncbi:long-chain fatty acid--CoA ligase [Sphingomonas sp. CL5.1]|nr:long-chain fatty acid--CoA ligase [Sphingomonas sp. CL5.1]
MFPIEFLRRAALAYQDAVAVIDGARTCTFRTLVARADAFGRALQKVTGKERPVVALLGPNNIEMLVAVMAIHATGGVVVPLNGRNATVELDGQIAFARPDIVIVHQGYLDKLSAPGVPVVIADSPPDNPRSLAAHERQGEGERPIWTASLHDVNGIKFTGGSSGRPKGVRQSFRCINNLVASVLLAFDFQPHDRFLCAAPMTHGAGAFLLPILSRGGCIVLSTDANPTTLLDLIERERITVTWVPPTLLYKLIDEQKASPRDITSLTHLIWGGAAAAVARLEEAREVFGPVMEVIYGQTEAPLMLAAGRSNEMQGARIASVGRPGPLVEVAILDQAGNQAEAGHIGEICARGDLLMDGYLDMPEETAATIRDGWLHTGDLGAFDNQGFLYVKGRIRDVVITGGFNVYPSDVEEAIASHPAVAEAVAFGLPDDHWGERLEAMVELRDGSDVIAQAILDHCRDLLGAVKTPKRLHIVGSLPRSPVGKVLRREARAAVMAAG